MSTTQPPVVLSSTVPSPSSTSDAPEPISDTSTLLFGFLVSALSIFAIFMTSAVIWNRLVARRRAIDAMLAMNPPRGLQRLYRPTMWDVWAMPYEQPHPWRDIKVSKPLGCDPDLAMNFPFASPWQLKNVFVLQASIGLRRRSRPYCPGDIIY